MLQFLLSELESVCLEEVIAEENAAAEVFEEEIMKH